MKLKMLRKVNFDCKIYREFGKVISKIICRFLWSRLRLLLDVRPASGIGTVVREELIAHNAEIDKRTDKLLMES